MSETAPPPGPPPSPAPAPGTTRKPQIPFEDFIKLDLRVATIRAAELHTGADRLLKLQLDDGTPDGRQVCAGIKAWYDPESLVGKQVVIVANLEPRKIRGEISEGMVLAASDLHEAGDGVEGEKDVVVVTIDRAVKAGSAVS